MLFQVQVMLSRFRRTPGSLALVAFLVLVQWGGDTTLRAQDGNATWKTLWMNTTRPPTYAWMGHALSYTGLAYDHVRDRLYVVSPRTDSGRPAPRVYVLDPSTGEVKGELAMDTNIVRGGHSKGRFSLYKIAVDDSGWIYACNLVSPAYAQDDGNFRIYRWKSPGAQPELVFDGAGISESRWADDMAVIGHKGTTRVYVVGGDASNTVMNKEIIRLMFDTTRSGFTRLCVHARLKSRLRNFSSHGIAPTGPRNTDPLWGDANGGSTKLIENGTGNLEPAVLRELPWEVTRSSGPVRFLRVDSTGKEYLLVCDGVNADGGDSTRARLIDVSAPDTAFVVGDPTPAVGSRPLNNGSGVANWVAGLDYRFDQETGRLTVFVLQSNNGIAAFRKRDDIDVPVRFEVFTGVFTPAGTVLRWKTSRERENMGFFVERKENRDEAWKTIGFVSAVRNGIHGDYRFVDAEAGRLDTLYYRLRQVDYDGAVAYSGAIAVVVERNPAAVAPSLRVYPNPFHSSTLLEITFPRPTHAVVAVYDLAGRQVADISDDVFAAGRHSLRFSPGTPGNGIYVLRVRTQTAILSRILVKLPSK